ncbi:hypothetical protein TraAM80_04952, partial [Trypanosoma rangeli]
SSQPKQRPGTPNLSKPNLRRRDARHAQQNKMCPGASSLRLLRNHGIFLHLAPPPCREICRHQCLPFAQRHGKRSGADAAPLAKKPFREGSPASPSQQKLVRQGAGPGHGETGPNKICTARRTHALPERIARSAHRRGGRR